ncbi:hypothetical protein UC8_17470 [Roseimaritima ulvae]|uniref:Uncharacterized protein n=2 Tax=Roseimaritima ulvae TaxID=980254 RepID=A0A5B9QP76_9BACT|nr:hypothetical protein UC8_17470 [Roseimaritima ulvae]
MNDKSDEGKNTKSSQTPANPQIGEQLDALADLCFQKLNGDESELDRRSEPLLKSLLMSGYVRQHGQNITASIETRVKKKYREQAMHRGGALSSITEGLQQQFDHLVKWESQQPRQETPSKPANISSATDA